MSRACPAVTLQWQSEQPIHLLFYPCNIISLREQPCWISPLVNDELEEVPANVTTSTLLLGQLGLEELKHRVSVWSIHVYFGEQGKRDLVVFRAKLADFLLSSGLLVSELVTGEGKDLETVGAILFIGGLEALVIGICEATLARHVCDNHHLAPEFIQRAHVAVDVSCRQSKEPLSLEGSLKLLLLLQLLLLLLLLQLRWRLLLFLLLLLLLLPLLQSIRVLRLIVLLLSVTPFFLCLLFYPVPLLLFLGLLLLPLLQMLMVLLPTIIAITSCVPPCFATLLKTMFLAGCHNALVVILCVASAYGIGNEAIAQAAGNEQQHHSPIGYGGVCSAPP
mmetsp:Transcript_17756/g.46543  ORF Transcript_17756/g.46543 Transcript_17756/m.46543 type:complete len:335 (+) Transcript_17756:18-1022(+)